MTEKELKQELKKGQVASRYLLVGDEPLLMENAVTAIKEALGIKAELDLEIHSAAELNLEEIVPRLYMNSLLASRRLFVIKNLEELDEGELKNLAAAAGTGSLPNCLIMMYRSQKEDNNFTRTATRVAGFFPQTECVVFAPEKHKVREWITRRSQRQQMGLTPQMISYLEEEFETDVTGLKNELDKIENYLYEHKSLTPADIHDLAVGAGALNPMRFTDDFFRGQASTLRNFEDCRLYLEKNDYPGLVYGLAWRLLKLADRFRDRAAIVSLLDELLTLDRKIKTGSWFIDVYFELLLEQKWQLFGKGDGYGQ